MVATQMGNLLLATSLFVLSHIVLSSLSIRRPFVKVVGEMAFLGLYSALSLTLLVWIVLAYTDAPYHELWSPPIGLMHLSLVIMPVACVLVVCGITTPSPTAVSLDPQGLADREPVGVQKITRHPMMWGIILWGVAHLLANGDAAGMIVFAGMVVLAVVGAFHIDAKKRRMLGHGWQRFADTTSFVPFAAMMAGRTRLRVAEIGWWRIALGLAVFAGMITVHETLFGVDVLPLP